jgi:hypothetical protein
MTGAGRLASAVLLALAAAAGRAQETSPVPAGEPEKPAWEFTASLWGYFPPDDRHYAQPTVTADRGALHLEARYNYEGFGTGSAWVGWNFEAGEKVKLEATLLAGGVFGNTRGAAPGYLMTLSSGSFELYSEGEYVFDVDDSDNNFFYNWAQLGYAPTDWLKVGLASQRTRAYHTGLDVQRGVFAGFTYGKASLHVYVFNLGWETPTVVASLSLAF